MSAATYSLEAGSGFLARKKSPVIWRFLLKHEFFCDTLLTWLAVPKWCASEITAYSVCKACNEEVKSYGFDSIPWQSRVVCCPIYRREHDRPLRAKP
ncbi:MAG: hypothetical protein FWF77_05915 [Defluviitaleaceae bacterium]|nr:hypothetical protein [Defluviitaleaceae bacterium]